MASLALDLFAAVSHACDGDGRLLCEKFIELPEKAAAPGLYDGREAPLSLTDIASRLYPPPRRAPALPAYTLRDVRRDFKKLIAVAKKYAPTGGPLGKEAAALEVGPPFLRRSRPFV